jgi:hypothetical protein
MIVNEVLTTFDKKSLSYEKKFCTWYIFSHDNIFIM